MRTLVVLGLALGMVTAACRADGSGLVVVAGRSFDDPAALAEWLDSSVVCLSGGTATMGMDDGAPDEGPAHLVTLDPFCLSRFEVTNAQYARWAVAVAGRVPPYWEDGAPPEDTGALPVVGVDWNEAAGYCEWIGGRLPTEAEWERACRGDDARHYPWGDEWDPERANILTGEVPDLDGLWVGAAGSRLPAGAVMQPVGSYPAGATPEGVHDLCGNAAEWVADWHAADAYRTLPARNPISTGPPWNHVIRGGAWVIPVDVPELAGRIGSCTARDASHADQSARIGFRCAFPAAP